MYKVHIFWLAVIGVVLFVISYGFGIEYDSNLINSLMVTVSIVFGFNITAISTLYSRKFIGALHRKIDKCKPGQTQLQSLKMYFSFSCKTALFTITYLIAFQIGASRCKYIVCGILDLELGLNAIIPSLISTNLIVLLLLLRVYLKGLIAENNEC